MKVRESKLRMGWVKMDKHYRGSSSSFKASKQERSWQVLSRDGIPSVGAQRILDSPPPAKPGGTLEGSVVLP